MSEVFSRLNEMTLTKWAIPGEIYKLELTAFARLELSQYLASRIDLENIPRQVRYQRDQESYGGAPIDSVSVAISSVSSIKSWDVDVPVLDQPVIGSHDRSNWAQEDGEASHKVQKTGC